jgi:hypothetical protein
LTHLRVRVFFEFVFYSTSSSCRVLCFRSFVRVGNVKILSG